MKGYKIISIIAHPVFITTYLVALTIYQPSSYIYHVLNPSGRNLLLGFTFILTVAAPLLSTAYLHRANIISSLEVPNRKERFYPLFISAIYTAGTTYIFYRLNVPPILFAVISTCLIGILVTFLITFFWKISAHIMGLSGAAGIYLYLILSPIQVPVHLLGFLFLITGFTGMARIKLGAHTTSQVMVAWVIAMPIAFISMRLISSGMLLRF